MQLQYFKVMTAGLLRVQLQSSLRQLSAGSKSSGCDALQTHNMIH